MKVTIEYKALLNLLLACGEAQGVLLRGSEVGDGTTGWRSFTQASASAREELQKAMEALVPEPLAPAAQQEFHSGPG